MLPKEDLFEALKGEVRKFPYTEEMEPITHPDPLQRKLIQASIWACRAFPEVYQSRPGLAIYGGPRLEDVFDNFEFHIVVKKKIP